MSSGNRFTTRSWYWTVVATRVGQEQRAAHHAEQLGFKFYAPRVLVLRGSVEVREVLFPGCLLVRVRRDNWMPLRRIREVHRVFLCDEHPSRIPDHEIDALREREDARGFVVVAPLFAPGDAVRVSDGHRMAGLVGTVHMAAGDRVRVLIEMLGRKASLEFDARLLEAA